MSEIEILFDHREHAAELGIVLSEEHEILPDSEWVLWARRFSGIKDLFVYFHKIQGTFVLSKWLYHPKIDGIGILLELEAFPTPPNWHPPTQDWVRNRLQPADQMAKLMRKSIRQRKTDKRRQELDDHAEKNRVADWMQKKTGDSEATESFRRKKWVNNKSAESLEFTKDLVNSSKGRTVTGIN